MGERDGGEAALAGPADQPGHQDEQHQHRDAGDDVGHDQRRGDEAGEGGAAAEAAEAGEGEAGHGAEDRGELAETKAIWSERSGGVDDLVVLEELPYHWVEKPPQTVARRDLLKEKTIIERIGR